MTQINIDEVAAVILAGGKSRRMAGVNKLQLKFAKGTLLTHILARLQCQTDYVLLNCNDNALLAATEIDIPVISDVHTGKAGPLDGIISTMEWLLLHKPTCRWLLTVPVDCPFIPGNFLQKLIAGAAENNEVEITLARSAQQQHFTCALWSLNLAATGRHFLDSGARALKHFVAEHDVVEIDFPVRGVDPFFNVNTLEDYEHALALLASKQM